MEAYINVMELLVKEEVKRQLQPLPPWVATELKFDDLIAYALNRLPPLYASTLEGIEFQREKADSQLASQIETSVQQALATIKQDPNRETTPLPPLRQAEPHQTALERIKVLLQNHSLDWQTLPNAVELALLQATRLRATEMPELETKQLNVAPLPNRRRMSLQTAKRLRKPPTLEKEASSQSDSSGS